jgi:D-beta-D-heptose 7-phosphate kinase/D-beta-D-heptose 1-phosphate adenosyltransferase
MSSFTPKVWGFEDEIVNVDYCGKRMFVKEQHRCSVHKHDIKDEVLMVGNDDGLLWFEVGSDPKNLTGIFMECHERIRIKPGTWHRFAALHDTTIYEFSTHDRAEDSIRATKSERMSDDTYRGLLRKYFAGANKDRVLNTEQAGILAEALRREGRTIGMSNGCFDLPHLGHAVLLEQAKQRCDVLFVAVNSDEAVAKIKGPTRPFVDFKGRLGMVAYNRFVDYVVMSDSTDHVAIVNAIRPDVYITTTEIQGKCPEAVAISAYGGAIEIVDMLPGYNSTKISEKFLKAD